MAPLSARAGSLFGTCPRQRMPALSSAITSAQRRNKADIVQRSGGEYERTPRFESPFRDEDAIPTTKIPSFAKYMSKKPESSNKVFQYFMVGSMGLLTAAGAKATVQGAFRTIVYVMPHGKAGRQAETSIEIEADAIPSRFSCQHVCVGRRLGSGQG